MKEKIIKIIIAKDDYPLEQFINRPIINFFRRLFLSSHKECKECYERRKGMKVSNYLQCVIQECGCKEFEEKL